VAIEDKGVIEGVVRVLEGRGANLYHACQLKDFRSYIKLGGIPSRNKLFSSGLEFTLFDTDSIDKKNNVWDKVFGNFSDFGYQFAKKGTKSQPNPYGPIQIVFKPNALRAVTDLSITLRSAGARDFDRDEECLKSTHEFEKIFQFADSRQTQNANQKKNVAFDKELRIRFGRDDCTSPEFNCAIENEVVSFKDVAYIVVDSCLYKGRPLVDEVKKITNRSVHERKYFCPDKKLIIEELSKLSASHDCAYEVLVAGEFASQRLKSWVSNCNAFHYDRFITYLTNGTTQA
jgi:hypothetical protein